MKNLNYLFILIILFGCSEKQPDAIKKEIVNGVEHVYNPNVPRFPERNIYLTKAAKFEIASTPGIPTSNVIGIDEHENLYYVNRFINKIEKFDLNGKFIRMIGREGTGPGEFLFPLDIIYSNGNEFKIYDISLFNLNVFKNDIFVRSEKIQNIFNPLFLNDSTYFVSSDTEKSSFSLLKYTLKNTYSGKIDGFQKGSKKIFTIKGITNCFSYPLFESDRIVKVSQKNNKILYETGNDFQMKIYNDFALERVIYVNYERVKIPASTIEEERKMHNEMMQSSDFNDAESLTRYPAINDFLMDDKGNLWVNTHDEKSEDGNNFNCWFIFNTEGVFETKIWLPNSILTLKIIQNGNMYCFEYEANEETVYIQKYKYEIK